MLLFNSKALLSQRKPRDAAVNFDVGYRNLQRNRSVLPAMTRHFVLWTQRLHFVRVGVRFKPRHPVDHHWRAVSGGFHSSQDNSRVPDACHWKRRRSSRTPSCNSTGRRRRRCLCHFMVSTPGTVQ